MADDRHYVPGDWYRICDRTGRKVRQGQTRREWDGLIVRTESWEPRQPQDLVRGVPDNESVPEPRPRSPDVYQVVESTLATKAVVGASSLVLTSSIGFKDGDQICIVLDNGGNGIFITSLVGAPVGNVVNIAADLPWTAAAGNHVRDFGFGAARPVTITDPAGNVFTDPAGNVLMG